MRHLPVAEKRHVLHRGVFRIYELHFLPGITRPLLTHSKGANTLVILGWSFPDSKGFTRDGPDDGTGRGHGD